MIKLSLSASRALHIIDAQLNQSHSTEHKERIESEQIEAVRIGINGEPEVYLKRIPKTGYYTTTTY